MSRCLRDNKQIVFTYSGNSRGRSDPREIVPWQPQWAVPRELRQSGGIACLSVLELLQSQWRPGTSFASSQSERVVVTKRNALADVSTSIRSLSCIESVLVTTLHHRLWGRAGAQIHCKPASQSLAWCKGVGKLDSPITLFNCPLLTKLLGQCFTWSMLIGYPTANPGTFHWIRNLNERKGNKTKQTWRSTDYTDYTECCHAIDKRLTVGPFIDHDGWVHELLDCCEGDEKRGILDCMINRLAWLESTKKIHDACCFE